MSDRFKSQNYDKLVKHHRALGVPWTDPTFPPSDASIGAAKVRELGRRIEWKRPSDLCKTPRLFVDGASSHDANQGRVGNCWFVAACAVLAGSKPLWEKVIPEYKDQEYGPTNEYSGVFRFRFWRFGSWVEVCVDDLLPCSVEGELLFSHSTEGNEFWGALLEKAYAKLHGAYEALDGGNLSDALVDFTSGVSEVFDITASGYRTDDQDKKKELFNIMCSEIEDHALMCCAIQMASREEMEERTDLGLVKGHAYGITAVKKVSIGGTGLASLFRGKEKLFLVRLQNPWGTKEWTGPFSDTSPEWANISESQREKLGLTFSDDGEFWMPFDDFLHQFTELAICRLINTSLFSFSKTWSEKQVTGAWNSSGKRAGGCLNHPETFLFNPQYRFDISKEDDGVIIQLSQSDVRELGQKKELLVIGFHIMRVEENRRYRLHRIQSPQVTSDYIKTKHIFLKATLPKGRFVIIPTTFKPDDTTTYLLRLFSDGDVNLKPLETDSPEIPWYKSCVVSNPVMATRVTVKGATGLEKQGTFGKADPYCLIKCEGDSVKSEVAEDTTSPKWKSASAIFYRSDPSKPIKVQIWNSNLVIDSFMGQGMVMAQPVGDAATNGESAAKSVYQTVNLFGRGQKKAESVPGEVTVEIESYDDLLRM